MEFGSEKEVRIGIWNLTLEFGSEKDQIRGGIGFGRDLVIVELHPPMSYDTIPPISEKEALLSTFCSSKTYSPTNYWKLCLEVLVI